MAVKIKLKRIGKMREPHYRIVVADARTKRQGRAIEEIGQYHPKENPSVIQLDSERAQYWLSVGAQPTEAVAAILRVTGDWQSFKGEAAPAPMLVAEAKPDKKAVFEAAAKDAMNASDAPATTPKTRKAPKAAAAAEAPAEAAPESAAVAPAETPAEPAVADAPAEPDSEPVAEPVAEQAAEDAAPGA